MLDLKLIREEPDEVKAALSRRETHLAALVDEVLRCDERWRAATATAENERAMQPYQLDAAKEHEQSAHAPSRAQNHRRTGREIALPSRRSC